MKRSTLALLGAAILFGPGLSAHAVTRAIYISPATMNPWPVYRADIVNPMLLSDTVNNRFRVAFLLPPDYVANTPIKLRLHLQGALNSACSMVLGVLYMDRMRGGQPIYETSPPALDGIKGNTDIVDIPAGTLLVKNFDITPQSLASAPFKSQKPGDGFHIWFERTKQNALDTCGVITVWQAEVRYESIQ